jgi:hypothetical protein
LSANRSHEDQSRSRLTRGWAVAQLVALLAVLLVLAARNPATISRLPDCPTLSMLNVHCPGCGSMRATHHLLNGRVATAWRHNPALLLLGLPVLGVYVVRLASRASGRRSSRAVRFPAWTAWAILAGLVLYTLARNIPHRSFDVLRPPEPASHPDHRSDGPNP